MSRPGGRVLFALVFVLCSALPLGAATPSFTIEQALSAPFPEGMVASPAGDAIAWVQNAAGVRNIWVAKAPAYQAAQVTQFYSDDGQEIGDVTWRPGGGAVLFTRGEGANGRGEVPNPRNDPAGTRQEVWIAMLPGGAAKLGDGRSPAVSPDNAAAVWISGGQVWSISLTARDAKPAQLIHARGSAGSLTWSPDGNHLAFVSDREDHALIGVYDVREKAMRYLDASVDTDRSPVWSPDSKQIAFIRIAATPGDFEFGPKRTGPPWTIRIADASSGKGHEAWKAAEGRGSVFWPMSAQSQLLWMSGDQLIFPWERDGWLHLYSLALGANGGAPKLLTPGESEVDHVAPSTDRKAVVFSSNRDDVDRKHLWSVSPDGAAPRRLTSGDGLEWAPAVLNDGRVALFHAGAKTPARAAIMDPAGALRDLAPATVPATFPAGAMAEPQPVMITAADGLRLHAQLFLPPDTKQKHPAVVFFHGGSRRQMLLGWHPMLYYNQAYGFNQYLASKGYVVVSINYRGGIGYGSDFREAPHYGATGGSEYADVLAVAAYLRGRADVDPARIGAWGGSYGGYLTALALARASDKFAVGVDLHGVHDWNLEVTRGAPARDLLKRREIERIAFESSPLASVATWKSPVLLIHGDDDRTVAFGQTVQLVEALRKQKVPFEQLIFPDEIHDFLVHADWVTAYHAADEFLGKYLKP